MLSQKMEAALNAQINAEYYSSYLYLSMAADSEAAGLKGFANWFQIQVQEETTHMMKFFNFVLERGVRVDLGPIEGPPTKWESALEAFQATLEHEQSVTAMINKLVDLAIAESDHATNNFLQWFVGEQVEEEATAGEILQQLKLIGDEPHALLMLDRELGQRVFVPPAGAEG